MLCSFAIILIYQIVNSGNSSVASLAYELVKQPRYFYGIYAEDKIQSHNLLYVCFISLFVHYAQRRVLQ